MALVKIILGSTRPGRFGEQPCHWLMEQTKSLEGHQFQLVDLKEINLPFLDEPAPPLMHQYTKDHTMAWSKVIDEADGFIFVTAEYDHSIPAALKNAIDFLFHEWNYKPASFVSYGSAAGGSRAVEHLRGVCGEIKMYDLREQLLLPDYYDNLDENGNYKFTEKQAELAKQILQQTAFWADRLTPIREELKQMS